jgi:hypothetical protein
MGNSRRCSLQHVGTMSNKILHMTYTLSEIKECEKCRLGMCYTQ